MNKRVARIYASAEEDRLHSQATDEEQDHLTLSLSVAHINKFRKLFYKISKEYHNGAATGSASSLCGGLKLGVDALGKSGKLECDRTSNQCVGSAPSSTTVTITLAAMYHHIGLDTSSTLFHGVAKHILALVYEVDIADREAADIYVTFNQVL
jgi:hypothetical protein